MFNVERNEDGLWLNTTNGNPQNFWNGNNRFVFRRRNSLHFPAPPFGGSGVFFFVSCPRHPPIIVY